MESLVDPVTFWGGCAGGIEQATNLFSGYGQVAKGYANAMRGVYGRALTGTMTVARFRRRGGSRTLVFYKGTGRFARERCMRLR